MKEIIIAAIMFAMAAVIMLQTAENRRLIDAHHNYVRRTELKQAEIAGGLVTLERIGINMHIMTHSDENIMWVEVTK